MGENREAETAYATQTCGKAVDFEADCNAKDSKKAPQQCINTATRLSESYIYRQPIPSRETKSRSTRDWNLSEISRPT